MNMHKVSTAIAALGLAVGMSTAARASIVYSLDISSTIPEVGGELSPLSDTLTGTITTDGTIGALQSSDILGWNLLLTDNYRPAYDVDLTPANSGIWFDTGNGLTATATGLSFDFSDAGAVFIIQGTTPYGFSSGYQYFCLQATNGPCIQGETIVPYYYGVDGVSATGLSGSIPLNSPEPATWALMLLGIGGLGAILRSRGPRAVAEA